jgi:Arsenate reductase and related proteins, glutaredoxin family
MTTVTIWHAKWCTPCRGTLSDLVPRLREEGIEPVFMDVDDHPCAAKSR